jgi:N-methylhydantoinase A
MSEIDPPDTHADAGYRVAVDVGGTFIDFVLHDERTGEMVIEKQPALPETLAQELVAGLTRLPVAPAAITRLFHGTTVAINTVVQERGASVGLITTQGFRDVLSIGRGARLEIYNVLYRPPQPLIARSVCREVPERIAADGTELLALNLDALDVEVDTLQASGVQAVAICFLHSYINPNHERAAAERIRARHPELAVTISSDIVTEWHEYERTSTAVLNGYLQPPFRRYLSELRDRLRAAGYTKPLALMQSSGGVISEDRAAELPIRTLESGPAGGVIGSQALARALGHRNVICADVGGTTFDVALIEDGEILERTRSVINGRPILGSSIDIVSIGAGGGSIASIDHRGAIKVGPESAGAHPGPACFGRGGLEPTVTDCHLILGYLDPETFLGSRLKLDLAVAQRAVSTRIAEPLGIGLEEAAHGILTTTETNMMHAIRLVTVERGLDPREFVLFAYGGGGGLFAAAVAEELEVPTVVIPRVPANFSAWGILASDYREDEALTRVRPLRQSEAASIIEDLEMLGESATRMLQAYGFRESAVIRLYRADLRFEGQEHTVTVTVDAAWLDDEQVLLRGLHDRFLTTHQQLYGHGSADHAVEIVTCRCRAIGHVARPDLGTWKVRRPAEAKGLRRVFVRDGGGYVNTPVFERDALAEGQVVPGPAIVEEWTTTIAVPSEWKAITDSLGNLILRWDGAEV